MNRTNFIICLIFVLAGCSESQSIKTRLDAYEQDIERNPQETYRILSGILNTYSSLTEEDEARLAVLTLKAKNLAYEPLGYKDTTLASNAIRYYCKNGDKQSLMWAYYLLGSIYRDVGDSPRGIEAFLKVREVADTTNSNCDFRVMARAMAQKSDLQSNQTVFSKAIASSAQAEYYAWKAKDTAYAMSIAFGRIGLHTLNGNYRPLIDQAPKLVQRCMEVGDTLLATYDVVGYAWVYLRLGMTNEAGRMLRFYDEYNGETYPIYYGTKGEFFLANNEIDSAEYYFRKELEAEDWNNRQTAFRGLRKVYEQKHFSDSALKYAKLQCDAVDSDYQHRVSATIVQMEQLYNYDAEKEKVMNSEMARLRLKSMLITVMLLFVLICIILYLGIRRYRTNLAKEKQARKEAQDSMQVYIEEVRQMSNVGEGVRQMKRRIMEKKHASSHDWEALQGQVLHYYPSFVKSIREQVSPLLEKELHVAMLIKMGFAPGEIANLIDQTSSSVSNIRTRLYAKAHGGKMVSAAEADEWIRSL